MDSDTDGQAVRQRQTIGAPGRDETDDGTSDDDTAEHGPFQCCWRTKNQYQTVLGLDPGLQQGEQALLSQCVPTNPELWATERYRDFLQFRRVALAERMNAFIRDKAQL